MTRPLDGQSTRPDEHAITIRGPALECLRRFAWLYGVGHMPDPLAKALDAALTEAWRAVPLDHPRRNSPSEVSRGQACIGKDMRRGKRPRAKEFPCTDCGCAWREGQPPHEWDHYQGYDREHRRDVQAVCVSCHRRRTHARRKKYGLA